VNFIVKDLKIVEGFKRVLEDLKSVGRFVR